MRGSTFLAIVVAVFVGFAGNSDEAFAARKRSDCSNPIVLKKVPPNARGGTFIWKSNYNLKFRREQTFAEGNHAQKGPAFLVFYTSPLAPKTFSIQVRDSNCNLIATMGRFPRCTNLGCGQHERWYLKTAGGSRDTIDSLSRKARKETGLDTIYIRLNGGRYARVSSVFNNREQK
jgi:hypothetical protein